MGWNSASCTARSHPPAIKKYKILFTITISLSLSHHYGQNILLRHGNVDLPQHEVLAARLDEDGEPVEAGLGGGGADLPAGVADVTRAGRDLLRGGGLEELPGNLGSPGPSLGTLLVEIRVPVILELLL